MVEYFFCYKSIKSCPKGFYYKVQIDEFIDEMGW